MILDERQKADLLRDLTYAVEELGDAMGMEHSELYGWTAKGRWLSEEQRAKIFRPPFKESYENVQRVMGRILDAATLR